MARIVREVGRPNIMLEPVVDWVNDVADFITDYLIRNNRKATGDTINSIRVVVTRPNEVELQGAPSLRWALGGRKAGKFPPVQAIRDWIQAKPINSDLSLNSLAFLIGRKIAQSGTNEPKLRQQNITLVVNQKAKKHLGELGTMQRKIAGQFMVELLTKNNPNTKKK